jgi:MYXO-CTERM domain-containing protein
MKAQQHLALLQPVSKATVTTTYTTSFAIPRQAGSLIILGVKRPVTGRNAFVEIEGEDYDGQTGVVKEDSGDSATLGQSINGKQGNSAYFLNVDFSDAGVGAVQLRVNAQTATTLELHVDSQTGPLMGTCQVAATGGSWAMQTCTLTPTSGVHTVYVVFGGTVRLNWMKFQAAGSTPGTGGSGGGGTSGGTGGVGGRVGTGGTGSGATTGSGGNNTTGSGGMGAGGDGAGTGGAGLPGTGGDGVSGTGGSGLPGSGGAGLPGSGGGPGSGGAPSTTGGGSSGCACDVGGAGQPSGALVMLALVAVVSRLRRRRTRGSR